MNRHKSIQLALSLLALLFMVGTASSYAQVSPSAKSDGSYTGLWNHRNSHGFWSVARFNSDGTWMVYNQVSGKWAVEGSSLVVHHKEHPEQVDRYELPAHDGALSGKDAAGDAETLVRREGSAPATLQSSLVGTWDFYNSRDGIRSRSNFAPDGSVSIEGRPNGFWVVADNRLLVTYKDVHEWLDTYSLPAKDNVLTGKNKNPDDITLTKVATRTAGATPNPQAAPGATPGALTGHWNFVNTGDGKHAAHFLTGDGRFLENGQAVGSWQTTGDRLVLSYKDHDWVDTYALPVDSGVLRGTNKGGQKLTLSRPGVVVKTTSSKTSTVTFNPTGKAPADGVPTRTSDSTDAGYFGTKTTGSVPATDGGGSPSPSPTKNP